MVKKHSIAHGSSSSSGPMELSNQSMNENFEVFNCDNYYVLIIGDSRSGKSTFVSLIDNINYVTENEIFRGTIIPATKNLFIKYNGKNYCVNIIDTPGFQEVSTDNNRSDDNLQDLITNFVKRDITKIHLVLIAVNASSGLNRYQIDSIKTTIKFLGKDLIKNTCVLVTHFDLKDESEENRWVEKFTSNRNVEFITRTSRKGFLFTGALDESMRRDVKIRDKFILLQQRRIKKFFNLLFESEPEPLSKTTIDKTKSLFMVSESVLRNYNRLKRLLPMLKETETKITYLRANLNELLEKTDGIPDDLKSRANEVVEKASKIGTPDYNILTDDRNLEIEIKKYDDIENNIMNQYNLAMKNNDELMEILNDLSTTVDMIEYAI